MSSRSTSTVLDEVRPTLVLAGPVILGQLGVMLMSIVDTMMVGPLGKEAVAAAGIGASTFSAVYVLGAGVLLALDRLVSVAYGAGRRIDCQRAMVQGLLVAALSSIPLAALLYAASGCLTRFGISPEIIPGAAVYIRVLAWSLLPTLLFTVLRSTLQAMGDVNFASVLLLAANVLNAAANRLFIFGGWGLPAMGVKGSAYATLVSRVTMLIILALYVRRRRIAEAPIEWRVERNLLRELLRLGVPAAGQLGLEVGVFSLATFLAANRQFGPAAAAAHNIVLQIASFTFMVPLGMSSAGAVRVGHALGRGDPEGARRAGWCAVSLGVGFMACSAVVLLSSAPLILGLFSPDPPTMALALKLLACAGVFQLADGAQVTLGGVLRGLGNTVAPMVSNAIGHWGIGLPIGWMLGFVLHFGVLGLWVGLASGLASVALALLVVWQRGTARLVVPAEGGMAA